MRQFSIAILSAAILAGCSSDPRVPSPAAPSEPAQAAAVAPVVIPEPAAEPPVAGPALPAVPGIYLWRGDTWETATVRTRYIPGSESDFTYAGTDGMPATDIPVCDDPCRFLILDMPNVDTTALYRSAANQKADNFVPASRYRWQAVVDLARPLRVEALRPGAYTVEMAARSDRGAFDYAALVAQQGVAHARAVFVIIRRARPGLAPTGPADGNSQAALAPEDSTFIDAQGGRAWGNRCFAHLAANRLDAAQAACDRGLAQATDQAVRGSLLYNLGRVAEARGERGRARELYRRSLAARPGNRVVQGRLDALGE